MSQSYTYYHDAKCLRLTITAKSVVFKDEGRRFTRGGPKDIANKIHEVTLPNGKKGRFIYTGPEDCPYERKYWTAEDLTKDILDNRYTSRHKFYHTKLVAGTDDVWFSVIRPRLYTLKGKPMDEETLRSFARRERLLRNPGKYADEVERLRVWRADPNRSYSNLPSVSWEASTLDDMRESRIEYTDHGMRITYRDGMPPWTNEYKVVFVEEQYVKWGGWKVVYMGTNIAANRKVTPSELKTTTEPGFVEYVEQRRALKEELVAKVFHPDRVERMNETYGVECWMDCVE